MTHNYFQKKHTQLCSFFTVLIFLLLNSFSINAQITDTFTATGSWTVPAGVVSVTVQIWGAGGGGGGSNTDTQGGSGGGSGAYVTKTMAVTAGTNYPFTIGTGGAGGAAGTAAAAASGGNSTINFGGLLTSGGGTGGVRNRGAFGTGGAASGGTTNTNGNPGIVGTTSGGKGGNSPNGGAGGAGGLDTAGSAGATPGAGGGGGERGTKNRGGGDGARGEIRFTYVVPGSYCAPTNTSSTSYYISGVTTTGGVTNFTNTGTGFSAYTNYSATNIVSQYASSSFSITATHPSSTYGYNVWIDWNNDTDFNDAGENVISTGYLSTPASLGSVTIPLGQAPGDYRMRVRNAYLSNPAPACGEFGYGEAEDYTVRVITPPACSGTPTAGTTTTSPASGTPGSSYTVSASGFTNATGLTYQWQYSLNGGAWTNQGAASVTYSNYTATAPALGTTVQWHLIVTCTSSGNSATSINGSFTSVNTQNIPTTGNNTVSCGTSIVLYDNGGAAGNYANSSSGYTVLDAGLGATITISGNYTTESVDYIRIYDGTGTGGTLLASYSGTGSINYTGTVGQTLTVQFYSDSSVVYSGFSLSVSYSGVCFPACAGIPTGGTVTTNPNTNWPGNPYTVTATGFTQALNMAYQWQYSTTGTGGPWINAGTATSSYANYNAIAPASGIVYWHLVVTCTNSSQTTTSSNGIFTTLAVSTVVTGCPNVVAGGLGLGNTDPATITCVTAGCVDLEATYLDLGQTTGYTVEAITYAPPRAFSGLANPVSVNTDDVWSPVVNLPFDFCFYGNKYTQCVIGSNGILSFNAALAGTSSGYSFNSNIPVSGNTVLRENSIFGVFHDIDPGVSGNVGWELITLPTGCRALVASWSNVPMFSDNAASLEYTGMMVLYENSNIIEVYVKQKKLDNAGAGTWNGGNAIIGIQNATGTLASVAPGRNGLDTNWEATNEAWRFVPSGASLTTIAWHEGTLAGPVVGTTPTINVCPSVTTNYFAEITYNLSCGGPVVKVNDQATVTVAANKVWDGSSSTDWNTAANWTPASIPIATESVVIPNVANDPIVGAGVAALACSLTVQNGAVLTVNASNSITVTNGITVAAGGTFNVKNTANLVQVSNTATNSGNINMERITNVRLQDYSYWSSPVGNAGAGTFPVQSVSPLTPAGYIFKWGTTTANANGGQGTWVSTLENMVPAKGYILRAPTGFTNVATSALTANFVGVPNNGIFSPTIFRGTDYTGVGTQGMVRTATDDNWNLVGNPYPSSIGVNEFLTLPANNNIQGFVKIWTHGQLPTNPTNPFYQSYVSNYYPADYITINMTAATSGPLDYKIGAGQGFMVLMNPGAPGSSTVTFNNAMRNATFANTSFFKNTSSNASASVEHHRIWLDLVTPTGSANRTVVGYVTDATQAEDRLYDAFTDNKPSENFYSLLEGKPMVIQGRALPFDINDTVPMGIQIPSDGTYTIAIATVDGLFTAGGQTIYLEDKLLNVIHNLTASQYQFTATQGITNDRFVLRYTNQVLSTTDNDLSGNNVTVFASNNEIKINSTVENIKDYTIYNVLGQTLATKNNVNANQSIVNSIIKSNQALIVKIVLENGQTVIKKIIF